MDWDEILWRGPGKNNEELIKVPEAVYALSMINTLYTCKSIAYCLADSLVPIAMLK